MSTRKYYRRSWVTQRMLNRFPAWSSARSNKQSVAHQLLNPVGEGFEEIFKYINDEVKNKKLATSNMDLMDILYAVSLPKGFEFSRDQDDLHGDQFVVPYVIATKDGTEIEINPADENTVQSFYYDALPDRITYSSISATVTSVLSATALSSWSSKTINAMPVDSNGDTVANRVVVTLSGFENFIDRSRRMPSCFVVLTGTILGGAPASETIYANYNGVFASKRIWKEISDIEYYGLTPDTGTIKVDAFYFDQDRELDKYQLMVNDYTEKLMYHQLTNEVLDTSGPAVSILNQSVMIANNLTDLYKGENNLEAIIKKEAMYGGSSLTLNDIALQPFTNRIFAIDDTYLYVFDPYEDEVDYTGLKDATPGSMMEIQSTKVDYVRGDTADLRINWRRPVKRFNALRWTVEDPDGTEYHLDADGNTVTYGSADGWLYNNTYTELVFGPFTNSSGLEISAVNQSLDLTKRGTYKISLETKYVDNTNETAKLYLHTHSKTALKRLLLPATLQNMDNIAFDADQNLWFYSSGGTAYKAKLWYDNMLIDFEEKIIYLREDYDKVIVHPSEEWID